MKRYILFFVGCLMSLYVAAETEATANCNAPRVWIDNVSYRSATISWGRQSSHDYYEIHYEKAENWASYYTEEGPFLNTTSSYTLDNLSPNTEYKVCVVAKCTNGGWSDCVTYSFRTLPTPVCKTPSNVQVSEITGYSAKVTWTPGEAGQNYWEVRYHENGSSTYLYALAYDTPEATLQGLKKNTRYAVSVRAMCEDEITFDMFESNYSLESYFTTLDQNPPILTPQVEHTQTVEPDPYTCKAVSPVTLSSTYGYYVDRVLFYEVDRNGQLSKIDEGGVGTTCNVSPYVGNHTYVVAAGSTKINAPIRRSPAALEKLPDSQLPLVDGLDIKQYDVYYVKVNYHVEKHTVHVPADMISNKANYTLWTSAGTVDPATDKTFCGMDMYYCHVEGTSETLSNLKYTNNDPANVSIPVELNLNNSPYTYRVYIANRYQEIQWCDEFRIIVDQPQCQSGLVYAKWDDFMFVDNGEGGGNGKFVSYQWYNEGNIIRNATQQWIRTTLPQYGGKAPSGRYYVQITDVDGNSFFTCPTSFNDLPKSTVSNPHPNNAAPMRKLIKNGQLVIEYNGTLYNAQGAVIENE